MQGTVKWFENGKGYGFIVPDAGGPDIFVHFTAVEGSGFRTLTENQRVEFGTAQGSRGPQAANVRPAGQAPPGAGPQRARQGASGGDETARPAPDAHSLPRRERIGRAAPTGSDTAHTPR